MASNHPKTTSDIKVPTWVGLALIVCPVAFWSFIGYGIYRIARRMTSRV